MPDPTEKLVIYTGEHRSLTISSHGATRKLVRGEQTPVPAGIFDACQERDDVEAVTKAKPAGGKPAGDSGDADGS